MFVELAELSYGAAPDPTKPLTVPSLVEQYREVAIAACLKKSWPADSWRILAELWAYTDMDIIDVLRAAHPEKTDPEIMHLLENADWSVV